MNDIESRIHDILEASGLAYEIIECDPELADTAVFCAHYGYASEHSANAIVVRSKGGEVSYAACLVLAPTRLDVNKVVRKKLGARKASFASPEETRQITGMEIGGVTPICLPAGLPLWVDARIMALDYVILGGGNRSTKLIVDPKIFAATPETEVVEDLAKELAG
ncbi:MAG TPA: YbaK/EbsC family protein [Alphaproteobacteria bacterium]|jgi:prolyl-tRNA editing enzyme YbaK/EbsC (Cys-tRNA(Pro) deacylase)|nr:YbaK/EbsC family protein [Alphaproteobacteria bacterium]MDP6270746.1 YbaK/EbsC family protein [Alphaproteobacteria bacterium]MDP7428136.1 YbaK/EbsC family protein [Alphaproteobacteria bacterium]HJM51490.1 YbaK/EbsC family protein [Alphaproteobacteria bacterium]|tara:strand:- start:768 stop:1262 length:495 start_codon:yes stop_codon:yes gene_type:complete